MKNLENPQERPKKQTVFQMIHIEESEFQFIDQILNKIAE